MKQPTIDQRLAMRQRPHGSALMYQSWNDLLFLHWRAEPDAIQAKLPKGLFVDCFEDQAYLGLIPFYMRNIHFRWTPSLPWISYFLEINLRTYVVDEAGTPGVWFFSLDWIMRSDHEVSTSKSFHSLGSGTTQVLAEQRRLRENKLSAIGR